MTTRSKRIGAALAAAAVAAAVLAAGFFRMGWCAGMAPPGAADLARITLPPGFRIAAYAEVPHARSLCLGPAGVVFVSTRAADKVYAVLDKDGDGRTEEIVTVLSGLDTPNGVAYQDGDLYVAEISRVLRYKNIKDRLREPGPPEVVSDSFPGDRHHGWKFIAFGPDGLLYVPVGAPCNVCPISDPYASIMRMNPDGSGLAVFARGVRNTVGFDWDPATGQLWFTDNGRDWMGDDRPPDELNVAPGPGLHFGFPFCHGAGIVDPEHNPGRGCGEFTPPALELGAHVAALGMTFYTGAMFPERYRGGVFIAEHGSWNRSAPVGYRVVFVPVAGGRPAGQEVFAEGWLGPVSAWGRPVDALVLPDGSLLISDDKGGMVYRITYEGRGP